MVVGWSRLWLLSFDRPRLPWTGKGGDRRSRTWVEFTEGLASGWPQCRTVDSCWGHAYGGGTEGWSGHPEEVAWFSYCSHCHYTCHRDAVGVCIRGSWGPQLCLVYFFAVVQHMRGRVKVSGHECLNWWCKYRTFVPPGVLYVPYFWLVESIVCKYNWKIGIPLLRGGTSFVSHHVHRVTNIYGTFG